MAHRGLDGNWGWQRGLLLILADAFSPWRRGFQLGRLEGAGPAGAPRSLRPTHAVISSHLRRLLACPSHGCPPKLPGAHSTGSVRHTGGRGCCWRECWTLLCLIRPGVLKFPARRSFLSLHSGCLLVHTAFSFWPYSARRAWAIIIWHSSYPGQ